MTKRVNWLSNERVDIPDMDAGTNDLASGLLKQHFADFIQDNFARVAEGFRVQVTAPKTLTVYNGVSFDRSGQLLNNEDEDNTSRSITFGANGTYFVEVLFTLAASDTDARGFWDPVFDNGADPSGDLRLPGKEFGQNVATRLAVDWQIVSPISTSSFAILSNPNSLNIPIAQITVTGGVITGATTQTARSTLQEPAKIGDTKIKLFNTRVMPDGFTATVDAGGSPETATVINNDRDNNILTLSAGLSGAHLVGARVLVASVGAAAFLVENTTPELPGHDISALTGSIDLRPRYWQADEQRGYGLIQNPQDNTSHSDLQIRSLKDHVDFLAAELRELKYGAATATGVGATAPPGTFSLSPRYYEAPGSILGARTNTVSIGNGTTSWGDFNVAQMGSADAAFAAALAVITSHGGGTIFVKNGAYNITTTLTITTTTHIVGESRYGASINMTAAAYTLTFNGGSVSLENISITVSGSGLGAVHVIDDSAAVINNCTLYGILGEAGVALSGSINNSQIYAPKLFQATASGTAIIALMSGHAFSNCNITGAASGAGDRCLFYLANSSNCVVNNCIVGLSNAVTGSPDAYVGMISTHNLAINDCVFTDYATTSIAIDIEGGASSDITINGCLSTLHGGFVNINSQKEIRILNCKSEPASAPAAGTSFITVGTFFEVDDLSICDCYFIQNLAAHAGNAISAITLTKASGVTISRCRFDAFDTGIDIGASAGNINISDCTIAGATIAFPANGRRGIYIESGSAELINIRGCVIESMVDNTSGTMAGIEDHSIVGLRTITGCTFANIGGISINGVAYGYIAPNQIITFSLQISNCTFFSISSANSEVAGVSVTGGQDLVISNNTFNTLKSNTTNTYGIKLTTCNTSTISGNVMYAIGANVSVVNAHVYLHDCHHMSITGNTLRNLFGVLVGGGCVVATGDVNQFVVNDNVLCPTNNSLSSGIRISENVTSVHNLTLCGNVIGDDGDTIWTGVAVALSGGTNNNTITINNNSIYGFIDVGIGVEGTAGVITQSVTITGNTLYSESAGVVYGVKVSAPIGGFLLSTTISGNSVSLNYNATSTKQQQFGIHCFNTPSVVVSGNTVVASQPSLCQLITVQASAQFAVSGNTVIAVDPDLSLGPIYGIHANQDDGPSSGYITGNIIKRNAGTWTGGFIISTSGGNSVQTRALSYNVTSVGSDFVSNGNSGLLTPANGSLVTLAQDIGLNWVSG